MNPKSTMKNLPDKIYLNLGDECPYNADFRNLSEVTWSENKVNDNDVEYVRKSEWISVNERLPEERKVVLCYMPGMKDNYAEKDMYFDIAVLLEGEFVNLDAEIIHPSHWMPIPIPQLNPEKEER